MYSNDYLKRILFFDGFNTVHVFCSLFYFPNFYSDIINVEILLQKKLITKFQLSTKFFSVLIVILFFCFVVLFAY